MKKTENRLLKRELYFDNWDNQVEEEFVWLCNRLRSDRDSSKGLRLKFYRDDKGGFIRKYATKTLGTIYELLPEIIDWVENVKRIAKPLLKVKSSHTKILGFSWNATFVDTFVSIDLQFLQRSLLHAPTGHYYDESGLTAYVCRISKSKYAFIREGGDLIELWRADQEWYLQKTEQELIELGYIIPIENFM